MTAHDEVSERPVPLLTTLSGTGEQKSVCSDEKSFCLLRRTHGALLLPLGGRKGTLQLEQAQLVGERLSKE